MTPGFDRFRGSGNFLWLSDTVGYTDEKTHPWIHLTENPLMFTSPRDAAVPRLRWDLVVRVRREIEAGTYDTPEKWAIALARLQEDLEHENCTNDEQPA